MIDSTETNSSDKVVKNLHGHCHCKYSTARESWCGLQLIRAVQETFWEEITGVKRAHNFNFDGVLSVPGTSYISP